MSIENYGRYQLLKRIATGGMAQIYLARQTGLEGFEKLLVVKRILPHLAENQEFVRMFLDEARIAARLNHPNIVQIFDLGSQDGSFFIAMEYIHGEDVRRVWKRSANHGRTMPHPLVCRVMMDACAGLDYAHKKTDAAGKPLGIVHRDISPQNILVTFEGGVKVVDFGIAKAADQATVTRSGVLKGKYSYMSPEQANGEKLDHRSDIFALGIVLHELLTGNRLFKRVNDIQTLNAVTECKVPPPSAFVSSIPPDLDRLVLKALSKSPDGRFSSATELMVALEEWLIRHKLASSSAHLAAFMQELYRDRLEQEKAAGQPLLEETGDQLRGLTDEELLPKSFSLPPPAPVDDGAISLTGSERMTELGMPSLSDLENTHAERPPPKVGKDRPKTQESKATPAGVRERPAADPLRRSGELRTSGVNGQAGALKQSSELRSSGVNGQGAALKQSGELRTSGANAQGGVLKQSGELRTSGLNAQGLKQSGEGKQVELRQSGAAKPAPRFETNRFLIPEPGEDSQANTQTTEAGGNPWDGIEVSKSVTFGKPRPRRRLLPAIVSAISLAALSAIAVSVWVRRSQSSGPAISTIQLRSEPPGATVVVDGRPVLGEKTPLTLHSVTAGSHTVQLSLMGYLPHRSTFTAPESGVVELPLIRLAPEPPPVAEVATPDAGAVVTQGVVAQAPVPLTIRSQPLGALVLVDGKQAGRTPHTLDATPGAEVNFRVELTGFVPVARKVRVEGPGPAEETVTLERVRDADRERRTAKGKVRFVVKPWASVTCNAQELGTTPFSDRELPAGSYQCRFTHPELGEKVRRVEVRANALEKVLVQF